jgi:beta-mannosidase
MVRFISRLVGQDANETLVWHGTQEKYQRYDQIGGRFNSEFGIASFPHMDTIRSFISDPSELYFQSRTLDFHNKADGHERRIAAYVLENFQVSSTLEGYAYLSQLAQSEAMAYGYRGWRRQWGEGRKCGGALVWQLNDCWPATSWAIVDYYLRKKPAFYTIARAMRPVVVGVQREHQDWSVCHARPAKSSPYKVWVASSLTGNITVDVELRFVSIASGKDLRNPVLNKNRQVKPNGTTEISSGIVDNLKDEPHVLVARVLNEKGECLARDVDWPQPFKFQSFEDRGVRIEASEETYTFTADRPTKGLVIQEEDGIVLSDNCLDIIPGDSQVVSVRGGTRQAIEYRYLGSEYNSVSAK